MRDEGVRLDAVAELFDEDAHLDQRKGGAAVALGSAVAGPTELAEAPPLICGVRLASLEHTAQMWQEVLTKPTRPDARDHQTICSRPEAVLLDRERRPEPRRAHDATTWKLVFASAAMPSTLSTESSPSRTTRPAMTERPLRNSCKDIDN